MAALEELEQFDEEIFRIERDTPWIGGEDGTANKQGKALANRTRFLKAAINALGSEKQAHHDLLTALAALVTSADKALYFNGENSPALTTLTAFARSLLAVADAAAARAAIGAASQDDVATAVANLVGSSPAALDTVYELAAALGNNANFAAEVINALADKQQKAANLTALAALASAENKLPYATGSGTWALANLTAFARTLLAASNTAEAVAALGLTNIGVPVGTTIYVPSTTAPPGFIKKNGALLSRATYAALWEFAQTSGNIAATDGVWNGNVGQFSPGDGSTTFRIPDGRGEFTRGWDDWRGVDSGRALGSTQADDFKSHNHGLNMWGLTTFDNTGGPSAVGADTGGSSTGVANGSNTITLAGGAETRPRNIAELVCIKY